MFGELRDNSVFFLDASCTESGFSHWGGGTVLLAPDWKELKKHLTQYNIIVLVEASLLSEEGKEYLRLYCPFETQQIYSYEDFKEEFYVNAYCKKNIDQLGSIFFNSLHIRWLSHNIQRRQNKYRPVRTRALRCLKKARKNRLMRQNRAELYPLDHNNLPSYIK
jgi:hypothetical protein